MRTVVNKGKTGWSRAIQSDRLVACFDNGYRYDYPRFGVALLWFAPERRLSLTLWGFNRSTNIRLYGSRKLSWEC
jgi:hypothetical protein